MSEATVRNEKDVVFKIVFEDKDNLLSLYNALAGTNYEDASLIEINTLKDVVYVGMKNDLSFILDGRMSLFEHQSTVNANMPLRGLYYITDLYKQRYDGQQLYSTKLLKIPTPQFIVFYNGKTKLPDRMEMRLSDAFEHSTDQPDVEVVAHLININEGYSNELKSKCKPLLDYATFHQRIRENIEAGMTKEEAVNTAVDSCIRDGILADILKKERAKIMASILAEFDAEEYAEMLKRESMEEGISRGKLIGLIEQVCKKIRKNKSLEQIAEELEEELFVIQEICEVAKNYAPEYDEGKIYQELVKVNNR